MQEDDDLLRDTPGDGTETDDEEADDDAWPTDEDDQDGDASEDDADADDEDDDAEEAPSQGAEDTPSPEDVEKILARYQNDPQKLAAALRHAQQTIGRQGQELGVYRRQQTGDAPPPGAPDTTGNSQKPTDFENSPGQIAETDDPSAPAVVRDPNNPDVVWAQPNALGVLEATDEYWVGRYEALTGHFGGDATRAWFALQREQQAEQDRVARESRRVWETAQGRQTAQLQQAADGVARYLGAQFPEAAARQLATHYADQARREVDQALQRGAVSGQALLDPGLYQTVLSALVGRALIEGTLGQEVDLPPAEPPARGPGRPPRTERAAGPSAAASAPPVADPKVKRLAKETGMAPEEAARYASKDFVFES